jgi:hypothetical protein
MSSGDLLIQQCLGHMIRLWHPDRALHTLTWLTIDTGELPSPKMPSAAWLNISPVSCGKSNAPRSVSDAPHQPAEPATGAALPSQYSASRRACLEQGTLLHALKL